MSCHPHLTDEQKKGSWSSTRGSNIRREKLELPKLPIVNCHTIGEHARLLGNQHLAATGDALDPCGLVDVRAGQIGPP